MNDDVRQYSTVVLVLLYSEVVDLVTQRTARTRGLLQSSLSVCTIATLIVLLFSRLIFQMEWRQLALDPNSNRHFPYKCHVIANVSQSSVIKYSTVRVYNRAINIV